MKYMAYDDARVHSEQKNRTSLLGNNHQLHLHYGDLADGNGLMRLLREIEPHEVYNLGCSKSCSSQF